MAHRLWAATGDGQISDIHLSKFDAVREERFRDFLRSLEVVQPSLVVETGDVTDAVPGINFQRRGQVDVEWQAYAAALQDAKHILDTVPWLDIRGNHDAFNVPTFGHVNDLFVKHRWHRQVWCAGGGATNTVFARFNLACVVFAKPRVVD